MTKYETTRQMFINWAAKFIETYGYFPQVGQVTRKRGGAPGGYQMMRDVFGSMESFKYACHAQGLSTDLFSSKGAALQALRPHISKSFYQNLGGMSSISWRNLERILDTLGIDPVQQINS